jgi:phage terminase large subunit-like protein
MSVIESNEQFEAGSLISELLARLSGNVTYNGTVIVDRQWPFESNWGVWLPNVLPGPLTDKETGEIFSFGQHHMEMWEWTWALRLGVRPRPFIGIWPRGGGKSTTAEMVSVMVGAFNTRRYVLYVCGTQARAEDHVQNVAGMLESKAIAEYYPHVADRMLSKYGNSRGWTRNRLRCASGFTVDALGMDTTARGAKLDDARPDLIVFDDIDTETDSPATTKKLISRITKTFIPAGSPDLAVLFMQNLIHPESVASRLAGVSAQTADFLRNRIVSGPFPAVADLEWEEYPDPETGEVRYRFTAGRPIWAGKDLKRCEDECNSMGIAAFLSEMQQDVEPPSGGMFDQVPFDRLRIHRADLPELEKIEVWCDPAVTENDGSDSNGLIVVGKATTGHLYVLWSWESRSTPERTLSLAIQKALEYGATTVGVETNQGGDLWASTYSTLMHELRTNGIAVSGQLVKPEAWQPLPKFREEKAGASTGGKASRATPMLAAYQGGRIHHVEGTHAVLEKALRRFPETKPFDLVDAASWAFHSLTNGPKKMHVY